MLCVFGNGLIQNATVPESPKKLALGPYISSHAARAGVFSRRKIEVAGLASKGVSFAEQSLDQPGRNILRLLQRLALPRANSALTPLSNER